MFPFDDVIIFLSGFINVSVCPDLKSSFADNVLKCNFLNENVWIPIEISLKFIPKSLINNIPALVQIMVWRRTGDRPLYEPMMTRFNDAYMRHSASMS